MMFASAIVCSIVAGSMVMVCVLCIQVAAAILLSRRPTEHLPPKDRRSRLAVLVPAHNETAAILPTLTDISRQLRPTDRLLVVADNCTDDTAQVAIGAGATVVERHDPIRLGKGYALDFGIRHLASDPPDILIVIDADCRLDDGSLAALASHVDSTGRPAQALYLMHADQRSRAKHRLAEFAWRVKNWLRPLGFDNIGLPCHLMGTGMAFRWDNLNGARLASGHLVEDVELGLSLASKGLAPRFCPAARVTSRFPLSTAGTNTQRQRWEQGHLGLILTTVLPLIVRALAQRNWALLALSLDIAVPPIALLALILMSTAALALGMFAVLGLSVVVLILAVLNLAAFTMALIAAWMKFGRDLVPVTALPSICFQLMRKWSLYGRLLVGKRTAAWIRTERSP